MDETDSPQTPVELFLILAMIAQEGIPAQTVAPKFTGRFNKGVDYVGDLTQFEKEFDEDLARDRLRHRASSACRRTLKLSVHSGSDKFSLYPIINRLVKKHGAGLHVKTAGTTWLEEVIGLAEAGGEGLQIAQEIYAGALRALRRTDRPVCDGHRRRTRSACRRRERGRLGRRRISSARCATTRSYPAYNPHFRQFPRRLQGRRRDGTRAIRTRSRPTRRSSRAT